MEQFAEFVVNHWVLFLALLGILAMLAATSVGPALQGVKQVDPLQATQMVNHEGAVFVDVREDQEYQQGHIVNAVHVPLSRLQDRITSLDRYKTKPVIVVCQTGHRSARGFGLMRKHGFEAVYNLRGGIQAWKGANLPLKRG
jgi:rhodanese-related sulfurtransferase